ncbi:MAG: phospho-N-acetylmuramoyl-pentapeptide-transferase [Thermoflexales bacterium]|nr:phospho-N-acetylmuramoyl-pentapeptide-transferase [Thermoflexales bacterium]
MGTSLLAGVIACLLTMLLGGPYIRFLRRAKIGKQIRVDGPSSHMVKTGTPTMGGALFVGVTVVVLVTMYLYTRVGARLAPGFPPGLVLVGRSLGLAIVVMVAFAIFGGVDDYMGVKGVRRGEGMRGRSKAVIQLLIATTAAVIMNLAPAPSLGPDGLTFSDTPLFGISKVGIPGIAQPLDLGILWIPIAIFIIFASSNAVNLTDGLDGLAALISFVCFIVYGVIGFMQGQVFVTTFCMVLSGALLGFLWYNVHPAQLFMGDLGSEALGASLGMMALMTGQWLLFPIIVIVPVAEAASTTIQVLWFKYTKRKYGEGRRFFRMSPLHNHYVVQGWSETQLVQRFWLVGLLAGMIGIGLAVLGNP